MKTRRFLLALLLAVLARSLGLRAESSVDVRIDPEVLIPLGNPSQLIGYGASGKGG
jgi:hypothetical protein